MAGDWLVLYDADCGLCKWLLARLLAWDRSGRLRPLALQSRAAATLLADLTEPERMGSWHLISPNGGRFSAGAAFPPLLGLLPGGAPMAWLSARLPELSERGYRWVADHRSLPAKPLPATAKRNAAERIRRREARFE